MGFVLAISEGSWVSIGLGTMTILLVPAAAAFIRYKAKSDKAEIKADIMGDVDSKFTEELEPIVKRMDKHDTDFKDFKRDEIAPMKETLNELVTTTSVIQSQLGTVIAGQNKIERLMEKIFEKLDSKQDKH